MTNYVELFDESNLYSWDYIRIVYEDHGEGRVISERERYYDDGTIIREMYQDGVISEVIQEDSSADETPGGVHSWERVVTQFDDLGKVAFRRFDFDDGVICETTYDAGVKVSNLRYDASNDGEGDLYNWDFVASEFDEAGNMLSRHVAYDNGTTWSEEYDQGRLVFVENQDSASDDGTGTIGFHTWDRIVTLYDLDGQMADRLIEYDDGQTQQDLFFDGRIVETIKHDGSGADGSGAYNWDEIFIQYDDLGRTSHYSVRYDNGSHRDDFYQDGTLFRTEYIDAPTGPDSGHSWSRVDIIYDASGQMLERYTEFDDGTRKLDEYREGQLWKSASIDTLDGTGAHAWAEHVFVFDDTGTLESKGYLWDDGDIDVTLYLPDAGRVLRQIDGDESEAWEARETVFSDTGEVIAVTDYAEPSEVPFDFIPDGMFTGGSGGFGF